MTEEGKRFANLLDELKQQRDELRVRLHLAKAEVHDEWERLERKWDELKPPLEAAGRDVAQTSKNVVAAMELAADEITAGYKRIRDKLAQTKR